jgi:hypothetical protein
LMRSTNCVMRSPTPVLLVNNRIGG